MDLSASWPYLQGVAEHRLASNKTIRHVDNPDFGDIELMGAAGELATRRYLGLPENLHEHFDAGTDIEWKGHRLDVKTTHLTKNLAFRFLQWPNWKRVKADIVVLAAVDMHSQQAIIVGFVWKSEVNQAPLNKGRYTPCREIPVPRLHPIWELFVLPPKDRSAHPNLPHFQTA